MKRNLSVLNWGFLVGLFLWATQTAYAQPTASKEADLAAEYYTDGEYEKALNLYQRLCKTEDCEDYIYRIAACYSKLERFEDAQDYLKQQIRLHPDRPQLIALQANMLARSGQAERAKAMLDDLILKRLKTLTEFTAVGNYFVRAREYDHALRTYLQGRKLLRSEEVFAAALADLYREQNEYGKSVEEYLKLFRQVPAQWPTIRTQILNMVSEQSIPAMETAILGSITRVPEEMAFKELLYDFYLQAENYDEAYLQARSLDRLFHENGTRLFKLAELLQQNTRYDQSNVVFEYIIKNLKNSPLTQPAYIERVKNYELKAYTQKPVDTTSLRQAVRGYDELLGQFGRNPNLADAMYRKARLCLFYLNDLNCAKDELTILEGLRVDNQTSAEARLLMGDLLLIQGEFNKARLKYQEVEEIFKEGQTGALAKFRSAQLDYYKGEFKGAQSRLDILKDNTTNDIANDAIKLFLLIQDNLGMDSTSAVLEQFAAAQLLIFRHEYNSALPILDSILYKYPTHPLTDDIYWEKAQIALTRTKIDDAMGWLNRILEKYGEDVYGDDALFLKAEIYQYNQNNKEAAQKAYLELLTRYPGSLMTVEARRRIRQLRGEVPAGGS
jgi:tetratricopeptide (TPR) repeat protein